MFIHGEGITSFASTMDRAGRCGILLLLTVSFLVPSRVASQQVPRGANESRTTYGAPQSSAPVLAAHRFTSTAAIRSPFVTTQFGNALGIGSSSGLQLPPVVIGGKEYRFESGELLFSTLQIEYQHAVKEWLGVWAGLSLAGRLGTETRSLVSQGVTVVSGFHFGWLLRVWQTDDMVLSSAIGLTNTSYTAVDLKGFIEGIVDEVPTAENHLMRSAPLTIGRTGLHYAWAASQMIGVTAAADVGYGESPDRRAASEWYFDTGAVVDFDLRSKLAAPLGVAAGVHWTSVPDLGQSFEGKTTALVFRLDYIGRPDFNVGVEIASQWQGVRGLDDSVRFTTATMDFRYYF